MKVEVVGRPGLPVLMSLTVSVDVKQRLNRASRTGHSLSLIRQPTSEDIKQRLKKKKTVTAEERCGGNILNN